MNINYEKILELYGSNMLNEIKDNLKDVINNMNYLSNIGIIDIIDIFERYPMIFLYDKETFIEKVNNLTSNIPNYIEELDKNISLWESLL